MKKEWKLKELSPHGEAVLGVNGTFDEKELSAFREELKNLKTSLTLPDPVPRILYLRGITDSYRVQRFFYSSSTHKKTKLDWLYDPFEMKDCDIACERLVRAIDSKERIMILGDYDVDGTCGVSLFYMFLKELGMEPEIYIPDRIEEGYGISFAAVDKAVEEGIKLVVSIDCGITANEKVSYAKEKGVEFIICDHHLPPETLPDALAVIDVHRKDDNYPYKDLCGTAVAFKLACAIGSRLGKDDLAHKYLDLVAVATASDIVPLTDENRILVKEGLEMINTNPRFSFSRLIELSGLKGKKITTSNIVFTLAPRINAVGRMGDAKRAVHLITSDDPSIIEEFAQELQDVNEDRRFVDKSITDAAFKMFEESEDFENQKSIVIYNEEWHQGVVGIVAARLVEKYNRPAIVLTKSKDRTEGNGNSSDGDTVTEYVKGSARSIKAFDIYSALKQCDTLLKQFGGHEYAAGLELELENVEKFKEEFNRIAASGLTDEQLEPMIEYDAELELTDIDDRLIKILDYFEPYGPKNPTPLFVTKNVKIVGDVRKAKADTHIFRVMDTETKKNFECVFFNSDNYSNDIQTGKYCDICYSIDKNCWNGREYVKLRIRDLRSYTPI